MIVLAGATSQTFDMFVQDSSSTVGAGLSGLAFNTSGLKGYYRKGATGSATAITLATQTVGGAFSSGGFVEIDATNMKGQYRLDVPDAAISASGLTTVYLYGASNMAPVVREIQVVAFNPNDAVRLGLTALPNAVAGASGGLPLGDSSGRVDVGKLLGTAWLTPGVAGTPDVNAKLLGGTAQTGRDVGASVLLSTGTGTGQLDFTSGVVKTNVTQLLGTAWLTPGTAGTPDVNAKLIGGTAQTGRDIGASVLLSTGTGTGQLDFTSGVVKTNVVQLLGTAWLTPGTAGTPDVNAKLLGGTAQTGRDIGASVLLSNGTGTGQLKLASGYVAMTWADIAAPTTSVGLTGTTIATSQVVASVTGAVGSVTGAVGSVTGNVGGNVVGTVASVVGAVGSVTGNVGGSIGSLGATAKTDVKTQVTDGLNVDTYAESSAVPAATATLVAKIGWMAFLSRNKQTTSGTTDTIFADNGSTIVATSTISDSGTLYTHGKWA